MKSLNSFLIDLANNELKGNLLAWVISKYFENIDRSNKVNFYESLSVYYAKHKSDKDLPALPIIEDVLEIKEGSKDFRIKAVTLSKVRGIPDKIEGFPFGIDFTENNEIKNAIILGPNGTGKSSIFSALEYIYANRIGEAELRTYDEYNDGAKDFIDYLKHYKKDPECSVFTPSGEFSINNGIFPVQELRSKVNPNNFFISDFDIYDNGKKNYWGLSDDKSSFHFLIAKSLGLQDFINFQFLVDDLSKYRRIKESMELSRFINEKSEKETDIKNCSTEIRKREEEIKTLSETNISTKTNDLKKQTENDNLLYQKLKQKYLSQQLNLDEVFKILNIYVQSYKESKLGFLDEIHETETEFLTLGLEILKNPEIADCPFCNDSRKDIFTIKKEVITKVSEHEKIKAFKNKTSDFYTEAVDALIQLNSFFQTLLSSLNDELSDISNNPLFINLYNSQKELCKTLELTLSDIFVEINKVITTRVSYSQSNFDSLFNIITNQLSQDTFNINFNNVKSFLEYRNQAIANVEIELMKRQGFSTPLEKIAVLKSEIQKFLDQIILDNERISSIDKEIPKYQRQVDLRDNIKENAAAIKSVISNKISEVVNSVFEPIESTIKSVLDDYFNDTNVSLEIYRDPSIPKDGELSSEVLKARIVYNGQGGPVYLTPNEYFNTFRYRLFCLMVSCSVAIATRRVTSINIPFVLDDIFYASDYLNRSTIVNFLRKLLSLINKYSPPELDLQFIILTHDEMVFDCAIEAIDDNENNIEFSKIHPRDNIIYGRLFSGEEKDNKISEFEDQKFWNILYKIPSLIPNFYELIK